MEKFDFYADPSHGWAKVPRKLLKELNIDKKITSYSYVKGAHVYLEEDLDLQIFCNAMKEAGNEVAFTEHHTNSPSSIRSYNRYQGCK